MARNNERGLQLTFHKPTKRWRKRINGKDRWFGGGKGISDRASYHAALKKYRAYQDEQARKRASHLDKLINREDETWRERAAQAIESVDGDPGAAEKLAAFFRSGTAPTRSTPSDNGNGGPPSRRS